DRDGHPLWPAAIAGDHPQSIQGRDRGVVIVGMRRVKGCDPRGASQWECELDDGAVVELPALGMRLRRSCSRVLLPRVLHGPATGGGTVLGGSYDSDDTFFFTRLLWSPPRIDSVLALTVEGELRWQLPVQPIDYEIPTPIVGPDETVLFAHGDEL